MTVVPPSAPQAEAPTDPENQEEAIGQGSDAIAGIVESVRSSDRYDPTADPVLQVRDLYVRFNTENGTNHAVRGVSFDLRPGEVLGIVGESGSGKSVTSLAIMGLLAETAKTEGSIRLKGDELLGLSDKKMCAYRGDDIAMVFQDPLSSLTPVFTIGRQLDDAIAIHNPKMAKQDRIDRAVELLDVVGIPSPRERLTAYPHQFSGGMRQRVMIAIAMANEPSVLICDEPTTALDVTIQAQILEVLRRANELTGCAVIMITHDLGVIAGVADNVMVMYGGRGVEYADTHSLYQQPLMPYTAGLLASVPRADRPGGGNLVSIDGNPPNLLEEPTGCPFAPRCPLATDACLDGEPAFTEYEDGRYAACLRTPEIRRGEIDPGREFTDKSPKHETTAREGRPESEPVLELKDVQRHFPLTKGGIIKKRIGTVRAVDGVSFDIREGECLALVGESGSGKTTTLLEIMEMDPEQVGTVSLTGVKGSDRTKASAKARRTAVQMVFQDPLSSLDPRFTVYEIIAEPLEIIGMPAKQIQDRVFELMELVGLQPDHVNRFPVQFSGGQRQRIAIARALAVNPRLVVLDEPVSALDVSIQAGVINTLNRLKDELNLSYMLVTHDLSVVRHIADRIAVMYLGKLVESGSTKEIFENPQHPYTQALLSAIPIPDPVVEETRQRIILSGDLPSPLNMPEGCNFTSRCPLYARLPEDKQAVCRSAHPGETRIGDDHEFTCYFPQELVTLNPESGPGTPHHPDSPVAL
jgi:peptide/nickel transport system ATP-binding protein